MKNLFIIHGSYGNPQENWFPWLNSELEKQGFRVFVPQFPIPKSEERTPAYSGHNLKQWFRTMDKYKKYINEDTIFIAHNRGCIFTYHYLSTIEKPIQATYLVAPWITYHWYPKGWKIIDEFHCLPFEWNEIRKGCKQFVVYQSTNDDTPVSEGKLIAKKLNAKFEIVENAGHFNTQSGYTTFPQLLADINDVTR